MNDIVDRLRSPLVSFENNGTQHYQSLATEAANIIDHLRELVDTQDSALECRKADMEFLVSSIEDIETCLADEGNSLHDLEFCKLEALRITRAALKGNYYD